jgi:hypothetical protein
MLRTNIFLLGVLLCPLASWSADQIFDVKPGLWTISSTIQFSGMPPVPNLDQMTPEQRARIEAAMKNMSGRTNNVKSCITREGIEKALARASSGPGSSCAPKLASVSASKVELHIDCTQQQGAMKSNGDMTIERRDAEHFAGTGAMKATGANGHTMDVKWSMTGTFLASDCGDVKPADSK